MRPLAQDLGAAGRRWSYLMRLPVGATGRGGRRPAGKRVHGRRPRERGVALLMVMVSIAIMGTMVNEFAYEQRSTILAAVNAEAEVHAYFHARSAMEIARLVIISEKMAGQYIGMLSSLSPGSKKPQLQLWAYACKFAEIFNSGKVSAFGIDLFDLAGQKGIGLAKGGFSCTAEPEEGRTNVNAVRSLTEKQSLFYRLYPILRFLRGGRADELDRDLVEAILNIIDYADIDDNRTDVDPEGRITEGGGGEGRGYLDVSYEPKNAPYDTVEELRLVPGIEDDIYCMLKNRVTVYMTEKINVNTADLYTLRALVCENLLDPASQQACQQGVISGALAHPVDIALEWLHVCRQLKWALLTPPFSSGQDFVNFFNRLPPPLNAEVRVNGAQILQHVGTEARVIRIKAEGTYGKVTKHLEGVIDTSTGRYIYWKEN